MKLIKFLSFASLVLAAGSASLLAQNSTWNSTVTPSEWNSAPNWVGNTIADGAGNTADFSKLNIVANTTVNLTVNRTIGNLIFGDTASPSNNWTLAPGGGGGGQLTLAGVTPTITVNNLGVGQAIISAVINGSSGLTKNGTGTLALSGNNTFTGGVTIKDGTLRVATGTPLTNAGTITIGDGSGSARLLLAGSANLTNNITIGSGLHSNGAIEGSVANSTLSGNITITGPGPHFNSNGITVLTLQGRVTYTDGTVLQTLGTVIYSGSGSDYASIKTNTGGINTIKLGANNGLATGATVDLSSTTKLETFDLAGFNQSVANLKATVTTSTNSTVTNSGAGTSTLTLTSGSNSFGGVIQNGTSNVAIVVNGANQTLSGINTYTGGTTVSSGTLNLGNATNTLADTGAVTVSGGTLALGTNSDTVGAVTVSGGNITSSTGVLTGSSYDLQSGTVTAKLGGTGNATKSTGGTVTLSGANTFTGATTVAGGTLKANAANALGSTSGITITTGGTLMVSANASIGSTSNITLNSTATGNGTAAALVFSSTYNGTVGALVLNANSIFDLGSDPTGVQVHFSSITGLNTYTLSVYNWTGTTLWEGGTGNNTDQIYAGNSLNTTELNNISFYSSLDASSFRGTGYQIMTGDFSHELGPIPEPSTWVAMAALALAGTTIDIRRRRPSASSIIAPSPKSTSSSG